MKQTMNSNSNRNRILMYTIAAVILIFITVSVSATSDSTKVNAIEPDSSASRDIENQNLVAGGSTNVTVTITNVSQALSLMETLPFGWGLMRIYDDSDDFKNDANEWVWFNAGIDATKTVTYRVAVPSDAIPGTYNINGNISNSSGIIAGAAGENTIIISDVNGRSGGGSGIGGDLEIVYSESISENEAQAVEDNQDAVAADTDRVVSEESTRTDQDSEIETEFKTQESVSALSKTLVLGLGFIIALLGIVAIMRSKGWKLR